MLKKQNKKVGKKKRKTPSVNKERTECKKGAMVQLLQRPDGVTLQELMATSGWQAHSVRGFLSAALKKKMGLRVDSRKRDDGQRVYRIA